MKHPRTRTLLMVLLLVAGGAIVNVAVAWGCALRYPMANSPYEYGLTFGVDESCQRWWNANKPTFTLGATG